MIDSSKATSHQINSASAQVVAIGTSAGGLVALERILQALPANFPAAIVVVQHLSPHHDSLLAEILDQDCCLPVQQAATGHRLQAGHIYIAPPNYHLVITAENTLRLTKTNPHLFSRPSIDILFHSIAEVCQHPIAIILTGSNTDGCEGIQAIKQAGGITIAQSPETAKASRMPQAAIDSGLVDFVLPLDNIAAKLNQLIYED